MQGLEAEQRHSLSLKGTDLRETALCNLAPASKSNLLF
jgi:hypothetical protein